MQSTKMFIICLKKNFIIHVVFMLLYYFVLLFISITIKLYRLKIGFTVKTRVINSGKNFIFCYQSIKQITAYNKYNCEHLL